MSTAAQAVVDCLTDIATPRRVFCDRLEELEQRRRDWAGTLVSRLWLDEREHRSFDYGVEQVPTLRDGLDDALVAFIDGGAPDMAVIPERVIRRDTGTLLDVAAELVRCRVEIDNDFAALAPGIAEARDRLEAAFGPVRDRLSDWLEALSTEAGATDGEWGRIQKAWRTSFTLPTRFAGTLLDLSSAAIARYESGSRTPSMASLTAMVRRIVEVGPTAGLETARAIRSITRIFGVDYFAHLEGDPRSDLLTAIEDRLEALTTPQLRVIQALLADQGSLDQFIAWTASVPTRLLREVATAAVQS